MSVNNLDNEDIASDKALTEEKQFIIKMPSAIPKPDSLPVRSGTSQQNSVSMNFYQ